jgi:hypothetical protein
MAKRKQVAAQSIQPDATEEFGPQETATATAVLELPKAEPVVQKFRADPFPLKEVNLEGYKVQLQENRQARQMQIKFGDGSLNDKPSDDILAFVKAPDGKDGVKFHWKDEDRAWGTRIDAETPATSRLKAERVFKEVVKRVAEEMKVGRQL